MTASPSIDKASDILQRAISVGKAVDILRTACVKVSERTLREKARRIGAYREIGQAMFFLPEDLEKLMEPEPCLNSRNDQKRLSGLSGERLTVGASKKAHTAVQKAKQSNISNITTARKRQTTSTGKD